jgi:hypothetical protein
LLPLTGITLPAAPARAAETPRARAADDATSFGECFLNLDSECADGLTAWDTRAALTARDTDYLRRNQAASLVERMKRDDGYYTVRTGTPGDPYEVDGRLYVLVPFSTSFGRAIWTQRKTYLLGVSDDAGASWRFANGAMIDPKLFYAMFPQFTRADLPEISVAQVEFPKAAVSRYVRSTDGLFHLTEDGTVYALSFELRRKIKTETGLTITFEDPANAARPAAINAVLLPDQENFDVVSPPLNGFSNGAIYEAIVAGWDVKSGEVVFEHRQRLLYHPPLRLAAQDSQPDESPPVASGSVDADPESGRRSPARGVTLRH